MKKVASFLFALVVSAAAFAGNGPEKNAAETKELRVGMYVTKDNKVRLVVDKQQANEKAYVVLEDGINVYDRQVVNLKKGPSHLRYDVSDLGDGTYHFAVQVGKETIVKTLTLSTSPSQKSISFK